MHYIVTLLLWIVVLSFLVYVASTYKDGNKSSSLPLPSNATAVFLIGTNYTICGENNTGVLGSGQIASTEDIPNKKWRFDALPFQNSCLDMNGYGFASQPFVYNTFNVSSGNLAVIVSNTKTLNELVEIYFPSSQNWVQEL
jgi:hypothetical protein